MSRSEIDWGPLLREPPPNGWRPLVFTSAASRPGTDRAARDAPRRVSTEELQRRREANRPLLEAAAPYLRWTHAALVRVPHALSVTDRDGIVLDAVGTELAAERLGVAAGADRSELLPGLGGADAAGTAGWPVAILGMPHGGGHERRFATASALLHDPTGPVLGAVELTTDEGAFQPEYLALVAYLARILDGELAGHAGALLRHPDAAVDPTQPWKDLLDRAAALEGSVTSPADREALAALMAEVQGMRRQIERRAYLKWIDRGRPSGTEVQDWIEAEAELRPVHDLTRRLARVEARVAAWEGERRRRAAEEAVTRALADSNTLAATAPACLGAVGASLGWDLGLFWTVDRVAEILRLAGFWRASAECGLGCEELARQLIITPGLGLAGRAWATGEPVWSTDLAADAPGTQLTATALAAGFSSGCCFPIKDGDSVLGVLQFFSRRPEPADEDLLAVMDSVSSQVSQFIERREAEQALRDLAEERRLARRIQQGFLPRLAPQVPGFRIAGRSWPAEAVGGDYFDFFPLGDEGELGIALGDVSGHGVGAALLMGQARACLRALALTRSDPAVILSLTNRRLIEDVDPDHFLTLFLGRLDCRRQTLTYSSAGHWPGYLLDRQGRTKARLESTDVPLGVDPDATFQLADPVALAGGDRVLFLTDGVVEAAPPDGVPYGAERALEVVRRHLDLPPHLMIDAILDDVREYAGPAQVDDRTVVVLQVTE